MNPNTLETSLKSVVKDYLTLKRIFSYPIMQGLGSEPGLPDRVMHFRNKVHYLEVKRLRGKLSSTQLEFQAQCWADGIPYHVIRSLEDLQTIVENGVNSFGACEDF